MLSACRQTNYGKFKIKTILFGLCVDNSNIHPHTLENSAGMGFKVMKITCLKFTIGVFCLGRIASYY